MKKECCIVAAGPSPAFIKGGAFMIAADAGIEKLERAGVAPDLIIGDFDSLGHAPKGDNVLTFPKKKDDTDTLLAIKKAIELGFDTLYVSGGVGGKLDHTVANLQSLIYAKEHGARAFLCGEDQVACVIRNEELHFCKADCGRLSIFSLDAESDRIGIRGLEYEAEEISISYSFPLGVSNSFIGKEASISVGCGTLLVIWDGTPELIK